MASPHTLVIYGSSTIQLYHIPDIDLSVTRSKRIPVQSIWSYTDGNSRRHRNHVTYVWNDSCDEVPCVRLVSEESLHIIEMEATDSSTRLMVKKHRIIPIQLPPAVREDSTLTQRMMITKCQKVLWFHTDRHAFTFNCPTIDLNNPRKVGSIQFQMSQCEMGDSTFEGMDFDEVSGRILLVSCSIYGSVNMWRFHVGDVVQPEECTQEN